MNAKTHSKTYLTVRTIVRVLFHIILMILGVLAFYGVHAAVEAGWPGLILAAALWAILGVNFFVKRRRA